MNANGRVIAGPRSNGTSRQIAYRDPGFALTIDAIHGGEESSLPRGAARPHPLECRREDGGGTREDAWRDDGWTCSPQPRS